MSNAIAFPAHPTSEPEIGGPRPERLISGAPVHRTFVTYESADGKTFCGVWESTVGAWRVSYDEWESCTVLEGRCTVTPDGAAAIALAAGDTLVLEPGFTGVWEVTEPMRKTFVIRL